MTFADYIHVYMCVCIYVYLYVYLCILFLHVRKACKIYYTYSFFNKNIKCWIQELYHFFNLIFPHRTVDLSELASAQNTQSSSTHMARLHQNWQLLPLPVFYCTNRLSIFCFPHRTYLHFKPHPSFYSSLTSVEFSGLKIPPQILASLVCWYDISEYQQLKENI